MNEASEVKNRNGKQEKIGSASINQMNCILLKMKI